MAVPPFPLACCVAAAVWLAAEIPVARETVRRFRARESRRLAVLACLCAAADIAVLALGVAALGARDLNAIVPGWWRHVNWPTSLTILCLSFVPVGILFLTKGVCVAFTAVWFDIPRMDGAVLGRALLFFPLLFLLLASPFVRYRLLRRPTRWKLALFACLTAYLPLLPFFAAMVWSGK